MGIWNSHTSVGNILGSLIAGIWVSERWGLSFVVPGVITAAMGIVTFFFLIECEWTLPPHGPTALGEGSWLGEDSWSQSGRTGCGTRDKQPLGASVFSFVNGTNSLSIPGLVQI